MHVKATLSLLLVVAAVSGVVSCKKNPPTGPDIVTTTSSTSTIPPVPRLPISVVAPYIGQTINSVLEQALTQGLSATGAGRWTRNCPAGGTARVDLPANYQVQAGNVVMLTDTELVLTDCEIETKGSNFLDSPTLLGRVLNLIVRPVSAQARQRIVARGRPRTKGKWRAPVMTSRGPEYRFGEGARVTGSLDVSQVNCGGSPCSSQIGPISMDCNLDGKVCNGNIGGVGVTQGPPDTPPPPNPTTTTTTTTTTVPPSGVNVSGTWLVTTSGSTGGGRVNLSQQTGSTTVTGSSPDFTSGGGITVLQNSINGTNINGTVSLTQVISLRGSADGITVTTTLTVRYTLQAGSPVMNGSYTSTSVTVGAPVPPVNDSGSTTFTRQ